jgi:hypothetical protein
MEYELSQEAGKVAKHLIKQFHPDLGPKDIRYVMQIRKDAETGEAQQQMRKGKPVFADVKVVGGLNAFLISGEARTDSNGPTPIAVVVLSNYAWNKFNEKQREACLDEQLCRLDYNLETGRPTILDYDATVMTLNVKRFGAWHEDLQKMFEATKEMPLLQLMEETEPEKPKVKKAAAGATFDGPVSGNGKETTPLEPIKEVVSKKRGRSRIDQFRQH